MKKQDPFLVTPAGGSKFWVARGTGDKVGKFLMMGMNAGNRVVLRLAGGCGQMEPEERIAVVGSMVPEFDGYTGVLFTGATREVNDGVLNPMITDVPGMVAEKNPDCVSLGTVPKTWEDYLLRDSSRLSFSADDQLVPAPGLHAFLIMQEGAEAVMDWDGDLPAYFGYMEEWAENGFKPGLVAFNGGGVTWKEIEGSVNRGWHTFLVEGSGRKTDEFIERYRTEAGFKESLPKDHKVIIVGREPGSLRSALVANGFI